MFYAFLRNVAHSSSSLSLFAVYSRQKTKKLFVLCGAKVNGKLKLSATKRKEVGNFKVSSRIPPWGWRALSLSRAPDKVRVGELKRIEWGGMKLKKWGNEVKEVWRQHSGRSLLGSKKMLEPATPWRSLQYSVPQWVATLEKGEKEGCVYCCILRFAVILNLAYVSHTHTSNTHTQQTLQIRPSSVLLYCSIAAVVIFMTSRLHTHTHRTLIHTPYSTVCYFATLLANRLISLPPFVIY